MALFKATRSGLKTPAQDKAKPIRWVDQEGDGKELIGLIGNS
ncbi:MAG: hypothetical protein KatS3mg035_0999 [Bacteroidia bacterium]|nr:MAG: hypothetical protein KatS3mg035_0999 [Bacteroidia bacterium]